MTKIHEIYVYNAIRDAILNTPVNKMDKVNKPGDLSKSLNKETDKYKQKNLVKKNNYYRGRR